uniref:Uncharacterized protein n=1 Tax=Suricata suricatta TaxID=37032 RepID=A0A673USR8_SURSU
MKLKPNFPSPQNAAGSIHPLSTTMETSSQYCQQLSDYRLPSVGYPQGTGNSQIPQSKYAELLIIIKGLRKEIRLTYAREQEHHGKTKTRHHSCWSSSQDGWLKWNGTPDPSCLLAWNVFHFLPRWEDFSFSCPFHGS